MPHEFQVGDTVRLSHTKQEAEVMECIQDEHRGELLRVKLLGIAQPSVVYVPPGTVELVCPAAGNGERKLLT